MLRRSKKAIVPVVLLSLATVLFVLPSAADAGVAWPITLEVYIGKWKTVSSLTNYIVIVYEFLIGVTAIISTVVIMASGFQWAAAAGSQQQISKAQEGIKSAIIGLILALASFALLNFISSSLVNFPKITPTGLDFAAVAAGTGNAPASVGEACSSSQQQCLFAKNPYFSSKSTIEPHLKNITLDDGLGYKTTLQVNEDAYNAFQAAFTQIKSMNTNPTNTQKYKIILAGAYNYRPNVNKPECLSNHSFGYAIDINWDTNPNCPRGSSCYSSAQYTSNKCAQYEKCDMPDWFISVFTSNGFRWLGDTTSVKDYMHFEWYGHGCGG